MVHITIECTQDVAATLMPLLLKARELAHQQCPGWCGFYVPSNENFKLGSIEAINEDNEQSTFDSAAVIWQASAVFAYDIDGQQYEHTEPNVYLSDAGV